MKTKPLPNDLVGLVAIAEAVAAVLAERQAELDIAVEAFRTTTLSKAAILQRTGAFRRERRHSSLQAGFTATKPLRARTDETSPC